MTKTKQVVAGAAHRAFFDDVMKLTKEKYADTPAIELLAIFANTLGKMIALQDPMRYTNELVMKLVADNIEAGNAEAIKMILDEGQANFMDRTLGKKS